MAIASGARQSLSLVAESTQGTIGTATFETIRFNTLDLKLDIATFVSDEKRSDRQTGAVRHGFNSANGSVVADVTVQSHDTLYQGALSGTWAAAGAGNGVSVGTVTAVASGNKLTRATGSWITDGYLPGMVITISGYTAGAVGNNGTARIASVTSATELVLVSTASAPFTKTLVDASGGTVVMAGKSLRSGTELFTYAMEEKFNDITQYRLFLGMAVNGMAMSFAPNAIPTVTFDFVGMSSGVMSGSATANAYAAAGVHDPVNAISGALWEGGTVNAVMTACSINLANGRGVEGVLFSKYSPGVFEGRQEIKGTSTMFFTDATSYNKFVNETTTALSLFANDPNGTDWLYIYLPEVKYTTGEITSPKDGASSISFDWVATYEDNAGCAMYMQRSNV